MPEEEGLGIPRPFRDLLDAAQMRLAHIPLAATPQRERGNRH